MALHPLSLPAARIGGRAGQPSFRGWQVQPVLRGYREARGREDAREDFDQRAAARHRLTQATTRPGTPGRTAKGGELARGKLRMPNIEAAYLNLKNYS